MPAQRNRPTRMSEAWQEALSAARGLSPTLHTNNKHVRIWCCHRHSKTVMVCELQTYEASPWVSLSPQGCMQTAMTVTPPTSHSNRSLLIQSFCRDLCVASSIFVTVVTAVSVVVSRHITYTISHGLLRTTPCQHTSHVCGPTDTPRTRLLMNVPRDP